jgi:hypothetical protein
MTKQISNTLTRWHKVAERLKVGAAQLKQENISALMAGHRIDADSFNVRKAALQSTTAAALDEKTELYLALQNALFMIRKNLARTNTSAGVSDLLNEMEATKQRGDYYASLLETAEDCLSMAEYSSLASAKRSATTSTVLYGVNMTFVSPEEIARLTEARDAAKREVNGLADRLADANATKLSLELEDRVAAFLGL